MQLDFSEKIQDLNFMCPECYGFAEEISGEIWATEKNKGTKWDGKSRVSTDLYRKRHDEIFNKLQQEQRDLDASYRQSLKNKKEREDNEEYLKELKDKL